MAGKWTGPEDQVLRQGYPAGGAEAVRPSLPGRSLGAIHQRASRLGLVCALRGRRLRRSGRKAPAATAPRPRKEDHRAPGAERLAKARTRPCLTCGQPFRSAGNHNRLCQRCRTGSLTVFDLPQSVRM